MEKYDVIEKVSPYLHAIGRLVRSDVAGPPKTETPTGQQQQQHRHNDLFGVSNESADLTRGAGGAGKPGTAPAGMSTDGTAPPPPPPPRPSRMRYHQPPSAQPEPSATATQEPFPAPPPPQPPMPERVDSFLVTPVGPRPMPEDSSASFASPLPAQRSSNVFASPEASPPAATGFSAQEALGSAALTSAVGTCVMITRPDRQRAYILTTSFAIATRREAGETEAVFFETRTLGTGIKNVPTHPVKVKLRPERLFFTSAPDSVCRMTFQQRRLHADSVGYTVIACDVEGTGVNPQAIGNTTLCIRPLVLPLIFSAVPKIEEGDQHLIITHVDGVTRRSFGFEVECVFDGHSCYTTSDISTTFASGGAIFDRNGEFVGLHHEFGDVNDCIHMGTIVRHLYHSLVLGRLGVPVVTVSKEAVHQPQEHDGSVTGIETLGLAPNGEPMQDRNRPHGNGTVVADMQILEYETKKRRQKVKKTLAMRTHLEVFEEHYDSENYESLVLLLHAFHGHSQLLALIFDRMLSHEHRNDLESLARLGGVGILLEALASNRAYDVALIASGLTVVGRMSLFDENREALSRYSGVQTVLSILQDYVNTPAVVQWGVYALLNLVQPECHRARENISAIASFSGLRTVLTAVSKFPDERHLVRWGALTTGFIVEDNKTNFDLAVEANVCTVVFEAFKRHAVSDEFVAVGLVFVLSKLVQHDAFFAATDYFARAGIIPLLGQLFEQLRTCQEPQVLAGAVSATESILTAWPGATEEAVQHDFESRLSAVALARMTETPLHAGIFRVFKLLGVADPTGEHPHLQVPGG